MNRKEEILDQVLVLSPSTCAISYIRGALWADENTKTGGRELLVKTSNLLTDLNKGTANKADLHRLQTEIYEYLR